MVVSTAVQDRILLVVAIAAAALIQISIAASQILLGLGILLLLVFRQKLSFPRIWIPLACLFFWTALADVFSPDPWLGRAQIKKFFVFFFIPLIFTVFAEQFSKVFYLMMAWAVTATASGLLAVVQYVRSSHSSYISYVERRITGFESHWMTFGGLGTKRVSATARAMVFLKPPDADMGLRKHGNSRDCHCCSEVREASGSRLFRRYSTWSGSGGLA